MHKGDSFLGIVLPGSRSTALDEEVDVFAENIRDVEGFGGHKGDSTLGIMEPSSRATALDVEVDVFFANISAVAGFGGQKL